MSERTIRNWLKGEGGRTGRPPRSAEERRRALRIVARAWKELGVGAGWRTLHDHLVDAVPVRLLQESLREVKRLHRLHEKRRVERRRVHVEVLVSNVLWQQDAAHLGRTDTEAVQTEVLRDAALRGVLAASVGGVVTAADAVATLEAAIANVGDAPLVAGTDGGSPYKSHEYKACLARHRIVHLRNLPRTPQHNARAERVIRDVKEESGLGRGARLASRDEAAVRVAAACERLALRALVTAEPTPLTARYTPEERERFHNAVCCRIERAVRCARNARERRMAEREAIFAELEERGLIERTRGGAPLPAPNAEINS